MFPTGSKVLYKQARCQCVGGGFSEQIGIITDIITPPNNTLWYKVSSDHQGTYVVPESNIIRVIE